MEIRKPYDAHERVQIQFPNPSLTKQAMGQETDINNIMRKYEQDGIITHLSKYKGQYGDFTNVVDYHSALNTMIDADDAFASLPSRIRGEFDNDPGKFLEFVHNPENHDQMVEMGLANRPVAQIQTEGETLGKAVEDATAASEAPPKAE